MKQRRYRNLSWVGYLVVMLVINTIGGAFVFLTQGEWWPADFWTVQVYAHCIGFTVLAFSAALRFLIPQAKSSFPLRLSIMIPSIAAGCEIGTAIAAYSQGHPVVSGAFMRMSRLEQLIALTAAVAVIYLFWSQRRIAEEAAARAKTLQMATEVELRLLQAQLEPHMLFNTLANLHSLIEVDAERAQRMVEHLIKFMRCIVSASRKEMATLEEEFAMISSYLKLMAIRMESRLTFDLVLPESLAQSTLPAMLLQPLVENAIKHGLEPKVEGGVIRVEALQDGKRLQVSVSDTGVGLGGMENAERYGLAHVRERLQALYGHEAELSVRGLPAGGVCAIVRMPP